MASQFEHSYIIPLLLLILTFQCFHPSLAQSSPSNNSSGFSPSMVIVIVILCSAVLFLISFFVYIRHCARPNFSTTISTPTQVGLKTEIVQAFPTIQFSVVKAREIGNGDFECAVCLSEFEDQETLRLLPPCCHVFHSDCIDAWLANHVTCPVCRADLAACEATAADEIVLEIEPQAVDEVNAVDVEVEVENSRFSRSYSMGRWGEMVRSERWPSLFGRTMSASIDGDVKCNIVVAG